MALTFTQWLGTFTLIDQGGNESNPKVWLVGDSETDAADIEAAALVYAGRLNAVTDCVIKAVHVSKVLVDPAVSYGTGEAENVALIVADLDTEMDKTVNIRVPAPSAGIF